MHPERSLKLNFVWAFVGNSISAFCMWLLLVLLTKTAPVDTIGVFGVAQAISLPVSLFCSLKLQTIQVTDARNEFKFGHYYGARIIMSIIAVVITTIITSVFYSKRLVIIAFLLSVSYAIMSVREVFIAFMQKRERMDMIAISMSLQGVLSLLIFGVTFWVTGSLAIGILGLITARLLVLYIYDRSVVYLLNCRRNENAERLVPDWGKTKFLSLIWLTFPLGLVALLMQLFTSLPKLILEHNYGLRDTGYFAAISSLLIANTMISGALGQSVTPRLARYYAENIHAYKKLFYKLIGVGIAIGIPGLVVSIVFGKQILTLVFTPEYAKYSLVLVQIMIAGFVLVLFNFTNSALTSARILRPQLPIYLSSTGICLLFCFLLIPKFGMQGAAWAILLGYTSGFLGCLYFVLKAFKTDPVASICGKISTYD